MPGVPVHVIQRGHNRSACFFHENDYVYYLDQFAAQAKQFECAVHAYCLMTNHVHLLLTPESAHGCALMMKNVAQRYAQHVNRTDRQSGTLWEGRFRSCLVDSDAYLLACYRYVELNPVRANMVRHARDYRWSSYRANAEDKADPRVTPHERYLALGRGAAARRRPIARVPGWSGRGDDRGDPARDERRFRARQSTFRGSNRTGAGSTRHARQAWPSSQAKSVDKLAEQDNRGLPYVLDNRGLSPNFTLTPVVLLNTKSNAGIPRDRTEWWYDCWRWETWFSRRQRSFPHGYSNYSRASIMSVDQTDTIDFATVDNASGIYGSRSAIICLGMRTKATISFFCKTNSTRIYALSKVAR